MNWPAACAAVIPCLNEEATIRSVVTALRNHVDKVFVVDDGSSDQTAQTATLAGAEVLRFTTTQGKGAALQAGWKRVSESGFPWVLMLDGDGQHNPVDTPAFFKRADETSASLIIGNRMGNSQDMPWLRRFVNRWLSHRIEKIAGFPVPDSQCGFRLMLLAGLARAAPDALHFEIESEVLLQFLVSGLKVEFVPIQVIYKNEQSKIHPLQDTVRWFRWWRKAKKLKRRPVS